MGVGKTKVGEVINSLLGRHYASVSDPRYVTGQFNAHMAPLLILHADEAFWAGDQRSAGKLKDLVSGKTHFIEHKGIDPIRVANHIRLFVTGNPDWLWPAGFEERRVAMFDVSDKHMQDHAYFAAIDAEMDTGGREALLHYLLNFDLSKVNLRSVPKTAALLRQKIHAATPEQAWWMDTLMSGELPTQIGRVGVCRKTEVYTYYLEHAKTRGVNHRALETVVGMFLKKNVKGLKAAKARICNDDRAPTFEFPPLKECREQFAALLQQEIDWPEADEWKHSGRVSTPELELKPDTQNETFEQWCKRRGPELERKHEEVEQQKKEQRKSAREWKRKQAWEQKWFQKRDEQEKQERWQKRKG
jgi:hypothetical protein